VSTSLDVVASLSGSEELLFALDALDNRTKVVPSDVEQRAVPRIKASRGARNVSGKESLMEWVSLTRPESTVEQRKGESDWSEHTQESGHDAQEQVLAE
jgi:hypothetical protein